MAGMVQVHCTEGRFQTFYAHAGRSLDVMFDATYPWPSSMLVKVLGLTASVVMSWMLNEEVKLHKFRLACLVGEFTIEGLRSGPFGECWQARGLALHRPHRSVLHFDGIESVRIAKNCR